MYPEKIPINPSFEKNNIPRNKSISKRELLPNKHRKEEMTRRDILATAGLLFLSGALGSLSQKYNTENINPEEKKKLAEKIAEIMERKKDSIEKSEERNDSSHPSEEIALVERSAEEIREIAIEIETQGKEILKDNHLFPQKLFSKNFFIATQAQESDFKKEAQSKMGALGIMQVMPITIKEVFRYLEILEKEGKIKINLPKAEEITSADVDKLSQLIKSDPGLAEVFGKLYFADLFNNFEIGKDIYSLGGITKARKKLLVAYNWNPQDFKKNETKEENWPEESRRYYMNIFQNMRVLKEIQKSALDKKMKTNIHELSSLLLLELKRYKLEVSLDDPSIKNVMEDYLKNIHTLEKIKGKELKKNEIINMINKLNFKVYKAFASNRTFRKRDTFID